MKKILLAGVTNQTLDIFIQDSSSTTGAGLTGLTDASSGLDCHFRKGATGTVTELTLASQTVGGAHADGGFVAVDGTKMPGVYRLDLSDTIVDTAGTAIVMLKGATNMAPLILELQCVAVDLDDAVRMGLTAIPNATPGGSNGVLIAGTNSAATTFSAGLTISNASGTALTLSSSGSNGHGLNATGNGSGVGIRGQGGATGQGVLGVGGSTSGAGIRGTGTAGNAEGILGAGQGSGAGVRGTGGATGSGVLGVGGATSGSGIRGQGTAGNSSGIGAVGQGSAAGLAATGGATGQGILGTGGSTSGAGIRGTGTAGNAEGILGVGQGSAAGLRGTGGATGHGILGQGGTNGDGIKGALGGTGVDIRGNITGNVTGTVATVTTLTGHTAQTGDTFAQLPTNFSDMSIAVTTGRVDVGSWLGTAVTTSATTALPEVDAKSISDNAAAADSVQANIGNLDASVSTVDTVVDDIQTQIGTAGAGLTDLGGMSTTMKAQVNTEVDGALDTTYAEPSKGAPGATISLRDKIGFLYKAWRNKSTQTETTYSLYNSDNSTVDHDATVSDDGTTATKGDVTDGP